MSKFIGFTLNEQTYVDDDFVEQGVYNGFGKIIDLGTIRCIRRKPIGFSAKELGDLFIEMGTKLKNINCSITDIKTAFILRESEYDIRKQLVLEITYKEI